MSPNSNKVVLYLKKAINYYIYLQETALFIGVFYAAELDRT